jgi:phosphatidylserine/phosphatidylglycerophosphate/cardiolipin synthase-like enzyme
VGRARAVQVVDEALPPGAGQAGGPGDGPQGQPLDEPAAARPAAEARGAVAGRAVADDVGRPAARSRGRCGEGASIPPGDIYAGKGSTTDASTALITSANFSYHGLHENIEIGVKVVSSSVARLVEFFNSLIVAGQVTPVAWD